MAARWGQRLFFTLEVLDFNVEPEVISRLLGISPTYTRIKGEKRGENVNRRSIWACSSEEYEPDSDFDLSDFIASIDTIKYESIEEARKIGIVKFFVIIETVINTSYVKVPSNLLGVLSKLALDLEFDVYNFDRDELENLRRQKILR